MCVLEGKREEAERVSRSMHRGNGLNKNVLSLLMIYRRLLKNFSSLLGNEAISHSSITMMSWQGCSFKLGDRPCPAALSECLMSPFPLRPVFVVYIAMNKV